ncbi:hypothetical protein Y699_07769 [Aspergillus fumigatus Z5]|nr:hypothetical protein Y699_07769 [Aspergillus fumigatus Z5]
MYHTSSYRKVVGKLENLGTLGLGNSTNIDDRRDVEAPATGGDEATKPVPERAEVAIQTPAILHENVLVEYTQPKELLRATLEYLPWEDLWTLYATSIAVRSHVLGPLFKHTEIWFHPDLPTVLNCKQLPAARTLEVLELSIMHIRSVHILRCSQHGPQEDGHCDPSGMFPGSLSFFPDVGLFYPFQFLEDLEVFQASTNLIVIPELPALRKLTISYEDSHRDFGCVKVDLSTLPWLSTFGLENMVSQSLLISGEALALRRVTISWSDFDLLDLQKLGQNVEEIEASFSNLLCPSHQCRIKLPNLQSLVLQHSVDFFRHLLTNELPSLEDLLIEGIYDDSDMRDFLPELSNPHDRDSIRLRANDGSLPQFLRQARSRIESWHDVKIKQQQQFLAELSLDKHGTTHWRP